MLIRLGYNQTEIAKMLGRDKSTISREISRNTGKRGRGAGEYRAELSQKKSELREKFKSKKLLLYRVYK